MNLHDELLNDDLNNLMNEPLSFLTADLFPPTNDIITISKQLEQLTIDVNTQNLKIEVERLKRQKLGRFVRQLKHESFSSRQLITQLQEENNTLKEQIATLNNTMSSEIARVTVLTHCCLGRLHHILISIVLIFECPLKTTMRHHN